MNFLKKIFANWKLWEIIWIILASVIIGAISILQKDTPISIIASLTGIWCVITTGKGIRISFVFGTINTLLYSYLAYRANFFGELGLNLLYYVPMNFVGFYFWSKHINDETDEIIKEKLNLKETLIFYPAIIFATLLLGFILKFMGGSSPFIDSMSTMFAIFAQILCTKRCREQWFLWIVVNITNVILWTTDCLRGNNSYLMVIMWTVYLLNAIFMCIKWNKEINKVKEVENV